MRFPMRLTWISYVAPKPLKGGGAQKRKTTVFRVQLHFVEESLLQSEVTTVSRNVLLRTLIRSLV